MTERRTVAHLQSDHRIRASIAAGQQKIRAPHVADRISVEEPCPIDCQIAADLLVQLDEEKSAIQPTAVGEIAERGCNHIGGTGGPRKEWASIRRA